MNKDIRLSTIFFKNLKTLKLKRRLGSDGVIALLKIWIYAGTVRPNGVLEPLDDDELELIAEWMGDTGLLVKALMETGFIEKTDRGYAIHDWKDHNPYAFHAPDRALQARNAAEARWRRTENARSMPGASMEHAEGNAPSPSPSPSPFPNPNPEEAVVAELPFISIPLTGNTEHHVYPREIEEWRLLYPKVDIEQTLRDIRGWNLANPPKRKTARGINTHINSWLAKNQKTGSNGSRNVEEKEHWEK